jgi:hypothetical protein
MGFSMKKCTKCLQEYESSNMFFFKDSQKRDSLSSQCKKCITKRTCERQKKFNLGKEERERRRLKRLDKYVGISHDMITCIGIEEDGNRFKLKAVCKCGTVRLFRDSYDFKRIKTCGGHECKNLIRGQSISNFYYPTQDDKNRYKTQRKISEKFVSLL